MDKSTALKILTNLKNSVQSSHKVIMYYTDGTSETIPFTKAIERYTTTGTPPKVKQIDFIGNYTKQGILPKMLLYLAGIEKE